MDTIFSKKQMSEEDIKLQYITPALLAKWDIKKITMETAPVNNFTDGKVLIKGNVPSRDKGKRCDYVLWYNRGTPLAIVEAKDNNHCSSYGMQQAISYGIMMNVPFVYTSNGDSFFEHDFTTGLEKEFPLSEFPTADELYARWKGVDSKKILEVESRERYELDGNVSVYDVPLCFEEKLLNTPFYSGSNCYPPRYYQRNAVNRTLAEWQEKVKLNPKAKKPAPIVASEIDEDEIPFEIPENWCWVKGKNIFAPMESIKPKGETFIYIDTDAVNNKLNIIDNPKYLLVKDAPSRASRKLHQGDVLFSMVRPYLKNIAFVEDCFVDAIASTGFYVMTQIGMYSPKYLYYMVLSPYVIDGLHHFMKGDNSPSINTTDIDNFIYPLPPLEEQEEIVKIVEQVLPLCERGG